VARRPHAHGWRGPHAPSPPAHPITPHPHVWGLDHTQQERDKQGA